MNLQRQVLKSHYEFEQYMSKARWCSVWHQLDEVIKLKPKNVLEIGAGAGVFKLMAGICGVSVVTLDIDSELKPDYVGSATALPFKDGSYDVVCAFQMLEHLPYEFSLQAFREMVRVSGRYVVISLPDSRPVWRYQFHIPKIGSREFLINRPQLTAPKHKFDGEHYWEIGKQGYPLSRIIRDFSPTTATLVGTYRVMENPYHRFFTFKTS